MDFGGSGFALGVTVFVTVTVTGSGSLVVVGEGLGLGESQEGPMHVITKVWERAREKRNVRRRMVGREGCMMDLERW